MVTATATSTGGKIELEVAVAAGHGQHRSDGVVRERGAAQVGVQHNAGGVEHRPQFGAGSPHQSLPDVLFPVVRWPGSPGPGRIQSLPHGGDYGAPRCQLQKVLNRGLMHETVHRRELPPAVAHLFFFSESAAGRGLAGRMLSPGWRFLGGPTG
jgi:hypothetical protein